MEVRTVVVLLGIMVLVIGVFLPTLGDASYVDTPDNDKFADGPGVTIVIIAVVSLLMIVLGGIEAVWMMGIVALWIVLSDFNEQAAWAFYHESDEVLQIGWFIMLIGALLTVVGPWLGAFGSVGGSQQPPPSQSPYSPY